MYERRFSSGKFEREGTLGRKRVRTSLMWNGVMLNQALPSKVSRWRAEGIRGRRVFSGTGQCIKSRSCQHINSTHGPEGTG
jgi:hypothetical protein